MYYFYNIFVYFTAFLLRPISLFNKKIALFLNGRKQTFNKLKRIKKTDKTIWIHCASLGEFEQGRPIIEALKKECSTYKIVLTFFSPSGYEVRKDYKFADVICYLPLDTKTNAKKLLELIHPKLVIFVKYEFWPNILKELKEKKIKTLVVSAIFRKEQIFFKNHFLAKFMRKALQAITHFFVQNKESEYLLKSIGFNNVQVCSDTRFDRVSKIIEQDNNIKRIDDFINPNSDFVLVAGSTWEKDEEILIDYINNYSSNNQQFIIASHIIDINKLRKIKKAITKKTVFYSNDKIDNSAKVLIVDTIGILNKIYSYATAAYIGGGFGVGIHNILEPATFGIPIIIGSNYSKFQEARDLIKKEGCFVINNKQEFIKIIKRFETKSFLEKSGKSSKNYVIKNIGGTNCILTYIKKIVLPLQSN